MNILCFGDSNTWGYKPDKTGRFDENTRWTALLQKKLGHGVGEPDFDPPSVTDREHLNEAGHAALADAVYNKIIALGKGLANVI